VLDCVHAHHMCACTPYVCMHAICVHAHMPHAHAVGGVHAGTLIPRHIGNTCSLKSVMHAHSRARVPPRRHSHAFCRTHAHSCSRTQARARTDAHMHTCTCMHTCMARTRARTLTHAHALMHSRKARACVNTRWRESADSRTHSPARLRSYPLPTSRLRRDTDRCSMLLDRRFQKH